MKACDAAVLVLKATNQSGVMYGDHGLCHQIAERMGWEHEGPKTTRRVLRALAATPGPLVYEYVKTPPDSFARGQWVRSFRLKNSEARGVPAEGFEPRDEAPPAQTSSEPIAEQGDDFEIEGWRVMSVNKVILVGNLGRDPELRSFPNGGQIANATLATSRRWTDKQTGEKREETEWHRLVFNNRLAEIAGQYLRKGSQIYVEGSLRTRKWQDQSGEDRYTTEVRVDHMQMLGARAGARQDDAGAQREPASRAPQYGERPQGARNNPYQAAKEGSAMAAAAFGGTSDGDDDLPY